MPHHISEPVSIQVKGSVDLQPESGSQVITAEYLGKIRDEHAEIERTRARVEFHESVFCDAKRAFLWWLDQHPEKLEKIPYETFTELWAKVEELQRVDSEAATIAEVDSFAKVVSEFVSRTDPDHATLATKLLREYLGYFNHFDLVQRTDRLSGGVNESNDETM